MIWVIGLLVLIPFGLVAFIGAPFVPTKKLEIENALQALDMKKGETLIDLGSGDGRVALAAAKRGIKVIGYEINPWLYLIAQLRCYKYRGSIKLYCRSFWGVILPSHADAVFVFGVSNIMKRLGEKLRRELPGVKLASFAFPLPDAKPTKRLGNIYTYKIGKT